MLHKHMHLYIKHFLIKLVANTDYLYHANPKSKIIKTNKEAEE